MIVKREKLNFWERLYLPAIWGGLRVTGRHFYRTFFKGKPVTMQYPEEKWVVPPGYRGAPYLVRDQAGRTKCVSCQLCEFVCPPKAIHITPPGPAGSPEAGNVEKAPAEFEINMLRCIFCGYCQEVCPEEAIFLMQDYSLTGTSRKEMIYNKEKLLALGGIHQDKVQKWKHKADEAREQGVPLENPTMHDYQAYLFYFFAALTLVCGALVILNRNPVNCTMFLVLAIASLAGLFVLLHAFFLAAIQVLVYAGAVMVLFLFVIMLLDLKEEQRRKIRTVGAVAGIVSVGAIGFVLWRAISGTQLPRVEPLAMPEGGTAALGRLLFTDYLLPFEILSVLLLVAMVGVILLSKKDLK